jgi:hypothetical protein
LIAPKEKSIIKIVSNKRIHLTRIRVEDSLRSISALAAQVILYVETKQKNVFASLYFNHREHNQPSPPAMAVAEELKDPETLTRNRLSEKNDNLFQQLDGEYLLIAKFSS